MTKTDWLKKIYSSKDLLNLEKVYDLWGKEYDIDLFDEGYSFPIVSAALVAKYVIRKKTKILDAGCGTGLIAAALAILNYKNIIGIDFSKGMLAVAKKRKLYKFLKKVDLTKKIPFPSNIFGTTLCFGVITKGHLGPEILDELIRVTKKGGFLIFTATQPVYNTLKFRNKISLLQKKKIISKVEITNTFFAMNKVKNSLVAKAYVYRVIY